jgi:hypothetical protein
MHKTRSYARLVGLLIAAAAVIAVLVIVLQLPGISVRKLLHGERVVASGQFWILELLAGGITSFIITGITVLLFRRVMIWVGAVSILMQLAWMTLTLEFASPAGSIGEVAFRTAEPVGIVLGAVLAVLVARGLLYGRSDTKR